MIFFWDLLESWGYYGLQGWGYYRFSSFMQVQWWGLLQALGWGVIIGSVVGGYYRLSSSMQVQWWGYYGVRDSVQVQWCVCVSADPHTALYHHLTLYIPFYTTLLYTTIYYVWKSVIKMWKSLITNVWKSVIKMWKSLYPIFT